MSGIIEVEAPDKTILEFPEGTSPEIIEEVMRRQYPMVEEPADTRSITEKILQSEYLDIGTGLGGAGAGAGLGFMVAGPPGAVVGGILGGMVGTGAGELAEDHFQGKELDYYNAFREGLISGGIDVALLGTGKFVGKPFINYIKSRKAIGLSPEAAAAEYIQKAKPGVGLPGSQESLAASQQILTSRGATLTPFQATGEFGMAQRIADIGIFSQSRGQRNYDLVNQAVSDELDEVVNQLAIRDVDPQTLGSAIYDTIETGRQAASGLYDAGMTKLQNEIGTTPVSTLGFRQTMQRFLNQGKVKSLESKATRPLYDDATSKFVNEIKDDLKALKTLSARDLIRYEKKLMSQIRKFSAFGTNTYNEQAARELSELSSRIRLAVSREIGRIDPQAAKEYNKIKKAYGEAIEGILPTNLKTYVNKADEGDYQQLGEIAGKTGSLDRLSKMLTSLEESHRQIAKAGGDLPVQNLSDVKDRIRAGFLRSVMPQIGAGKDFKIAKYQNLADRYNTPKEAARLRLVMGDKDAKVRQLFNLMSEASQTPSSNIGELMLRTKEYQAIGTGATAVQGAAGLASAATILLTPVFLSKVAYNPKTVNKLIALQNSKFKNSDALMVAVSNVVYDAMREMSDEDQAEIRNYVMQEGS